MIKVGANGKITLDQLFPHKDTSLVEYYAVEAKEAGKIVLRLYDEEGTMLGDLPPKKKLSCTKNLVAMTKSATNDCWSKAIKSMSRKYPGKSLLDLKLEHKDELDNAYRHMVCKLPTEVLEAIILCHNKGKFNRAKITLQAIANEIGNRTLLNDSSGKK